MPAPSEQALDTPLSPPPLNDEPGPATGRSGTYPDGTFTRRPGPACRTQHAGHAYAEIGKPDKALPHLRFYVQNADSSVGVDEEAKVLESRFVIAQMLASAGHIDEALTELDAIRPMLADTYGAESTQIRNLDKQISRLRSV